MFPFNMGLSVSVSVSVSVSLADETTTMNPGCKRKGHQFVMASCDCDGHERVVPSRLASARPLSRPLSCQSSSSLVPLLCHIFHSPLVYVISAYV